MHFRKSHIALLLVLCSLSTIMFAVVPAESSIAQTATVQQEPSCQPEVKKFVEEESAKYRKFLQKHLRSKKGTSDLLIVANQRYMQYRLTLINRRNLLTIQGRTIGSNEADRQICETLIERYLTTMSAWHKRMLIGNSERKRTLRLTERIRDLNGKLKNLNRETGVLQGYFETFANKIPCYAKSCISF